ncbi:MAG: hypothetical protein ACI3YF_10610, partial [Prevotella sp.]
MRKAVPHILIVVFVTIGVSFSCGRCPVDGLPQRFVKGAKVRDFIGVTKIFCIMFLKSAAIRVGEREWEGWMIRRDTKKAMLSMASGENRIRTCEPVLPVTRF